MCNLPDINAVVVREAKCDDVEPLPGQITPLIYAFGVAEAHAMKKIMQQKAALRCKWRNRIFRCMHIWHILTHLAYFDIPQISKSKCNVSTFKPLPLQPSDSPMHYLADADCTTAAEYRTSNKSWRPDIEDVLTAVAWSFAKRASVATYLPVHEAAPWNDRMCYRLCLFVKDCWTLARCRAQHPLSM